MYNTRRRFILFIAWGSLFATLPAIVVAAEARLPNIVVILADDYGWGSSGCYGATGLKTPNLDRLAKEGRRFTQAYAPGSVCSPTRYGLMTGRYYWRASIKDGEVLPGNAPLHIEPNRLTLASLCKRQGYRTAAFGKWHLGLGNESQTDWNKSLTPGPLTIGFDYFFGLAANPWNGPHTFIENEQLVGRIPGEAVAITGRRETAATTGIKQPWQEDQIMEQLTAKAVGWMEAERERPMFVYFAPTAVHEPVAPNPKFSGSPYGKYGDFIQELDASVGQILATLDRLQLTENTLVIFTSDNGGVANRNNPNAAAALDAGLAINGPLRGGKHDVWEGGFREPFLVRWPGHVPAGSVSDQVIGITDVLATLAAVLKTPLPPGNAEDSFNVLRAFTEPSPSLPIRDAVVLQAADATYALRAGKWKFIERADQPMFEHRNRNAAAKLAKKRQNAPHEDELFDLAADPGESINVASKHPDVVKRLKQALVLARTHGSTRPNINQ
jgi:arylsulfatase A-like enzyme